jgi:hypothetical protein
MIGPFYFIKQSIPLIDQGKLTRFPCNHTPILFIRGEAVAFTLAILFTTSFHTVKSPLSEMGAVSTLVKLLFVVVYMIDLLETEEIGSPYPKESTEFFPPLIDIQYFFGAVLKTAGAAIGIGKNVK